MLVLADTLFPGEKLESIGDGDLSVTCPPADEVHMGCFPGVSVVAAKEFGIDYPSRLARRFIDAGGSGTVTLHAMHSVVDWFAYAVWANGLLVNANLGSMGCGHSLAVYAGRCVGIGVLVTVVLSM